LKDELVSIFKHLAICCPTKVPDQYMYSVSSAPRRFKADMFLHIKPTKSWIASTIFAWLPIFLQLFVNVFDFHPEFFGQRISFFEQ